MRNPIHLAAVAATALLMAPTAAVAGVSGAYTESAQYPTQGATTCDNGACHGASGNVSVQISGDPTPGPA